MIKFTITGNPCSSKNSIRSGITKQGRNYTYKTKAVKEYFDKGLKELKRQSYEHYDTAWDWYGIMQDDTNELIDMDFPISSPCEVSFIFYVKDNRKRDLVNLCQAPCDLLQKARIIENDYLVASLDGSRIAGIDKDNPRTEIIIKVKE